MFVVDTNIFVYAADTGSPYHPLCREKIEEWRRRTEPWYATWGILYEFLRVTTHPRVFLRPWTAAAAWSFIEAVLAAPSFGLLVPTDRHAEAAAELIRTSSFLRGNLLFDAQTAALMREHGIKRIYTRDMDFHRFPFLEPIDPTA
jgi:hypothetical protein